MRTPETVGNIARHRVAVIHDGEGCYHGDFRTQTFSLISVLRMIQSTPDTTQSVWRQDRPQDAAVRMS
ncbi:hypothetical protein C8Q77DRAFT_1124713 [Trametes polyzona]|nr:hypothetical protein C8Q77DRAFT_1124713 [Trametes polyzona]